MLDPATGQECARARFDDGGRLLNPEESGFAKTFTGSFLVGPPDELFGLKLGLVIGGLAAIRSELLLLSAWGVVPFFAALRLFSWR